MVKKILVYIVTLVLLFLGFKPALTNSVCKGKNSSLVSSDFIVKEDLSDIPEYNGSAYITINNDIPIFKDEELKIIRDYGELDSLGRTTASIATVSKNTISKEDRSDIGFIKPSGWVQKKYSGIVDSNPPYVLNRSHLIMWFLQGNISNVKENLISATRYCNCEGFLPNEEEVVNYIKTTDNHVLIKATPYYIEDELMCRGILYEAMSIEDNGKSFHICRWIYNVQPGIEIDYKTGDSRISDDVKDEDRYIKGEYR